MVMKNDFNLDEERKKSDSRLIKGDREDGLQKKYDLRLSVLEVISIFIFILAVGFIIYSELMNKGGGSFWVS